jgi:hypothetical protein
MRVDPEEVMDVRPAGVDTWSKLSIRTVGQALRSQIPV